MKRDALNHTKMKRLCRRLDIPLYQAVGLLECIWRTAERETPRGDIGRMSDENIALAIDYRGDEHALISALLQCGWLEQSSEARLVIHDWPDHCEDSVHMKLARSRRFFANGTSPKLTKFAQAERVECAQFYEKSARNENGDACEQNGKNAFLRTRNARNNEPGAGNGEACAQNSDKNAPPKPKPLPKPLILANITDTNTCAPTHKNGADACVCDSPQNSTISQQPGGRSPELPDKTAAEVSSRREVDGLTPQQAVWFDEWWQAYWSHKAKLKARREFGKRVRTQELFTRVIAATAAQCPEMLAKLEQFRPQGFTWLNEGRWEEIPSQTAIPAPSKRDLGRAAVIRGAEAINRMKGG